MPKDVEMTPEIAARYSMIGTVFRQFEGLGDENLIARTTLAFAQARETNRLAYFDRGQVEGWRLAGILQSPRSIAFMGVRADGRIQGQKFHIDRRSKEGEAFLPAHRTDREFLDQTRLLADYVARNFDGNSLDAPEGTWANKEPFEDRELPIFLQTRNREFSDWCGKSAKTLLSPAYGVAMETILAGGLSGRAEEDTYPAFGKISGLVRQAEARRFGGLTRAFRAAIDPEVLHAMNRVVKHDIFFANWLSGEVVEKESSRLEPELGRNRRQALESFPILGEELMKRRTLARAVDRGDPLVPEISREINLEPAKVRRLRGVTWQKIGREYFENSWKIAGLVEPLAVDHMPQTRRGFAELGVATELAGVAAQINGVAQEDVIRDLGGRTARIARLAEGNPVMGVNDMQHHVRNALVSPVLYQALLKGGLSREDATEKTFEYAYKIKPLRGHTPQALLEMSGRWHRALPVLTAALEDEGRQENVGWPGLTGDLQLAGGITARELTSRDALQREGITQDHCVGGYTGRVLHGESIIYSFRRGEDVLSTIEIAPPDPEEEKSRPRVVQNMAASNEAPGPAARAAAAALEKTLARLPEEKWNGYHAGIAAVLEENPASGSGRLRALNERAGFDISDPEKPGIAWERLSPFLPRATRKLGLQGWIARDIRPVADHVLFICGEDVRIGSAMENETRSRAELADAR